MTLGGWRERLRDLSVRRETLDDNELVARTLKGDVRSYEELVRRYERLVGRVLYPYARREISVEDLVQETFLRAYDRLETFNPDYRFKTWLLAIANNLGVDTLRRRREIVEFNPETHARAGRDPRPRPSTPTAPECPGGGGDPARDLRCAPDPALLRGSLLRRDSRRYLDITIPAVRAGSSAPGT